MEKTDLKENERIDDLQYKNLKIIQDKKGFCFGIDSIILSDFAKKIKNKSKVVDLGTGTGVIGLLLCKKTQLDSIIGVEIQSEVSDMARRSVKLNKLEDRFNIINADVKEIFEKNILEKNCYDVVVMNPPYKEIGTGERNENEKKLISRHEIKAKLEDFINVGSKLLKDKGEMYLVHKPERMAEILVKLKEYKLEPKELQIVYAKEETDASLILIKAVKNGKKFLKIHEPIFVYDKNGKYTNKIQQIYNEK